MTKANIDIRQMAMNKGVCLWEIAEKMGIAEGSFSRKLRRELSKDEKTMIYEIIDSIIKARKE